MSKKTSTNQAHQKYILKSGETFPNFMERYVFYCTWCNKTVYVLIIKTLNEIHQVFTTNLLWIKVFFLYNKLMDRPKRHPISPHTPYILYTHVLLPIFQQFY